MKRIMFYTYKPFDKEVHITQKILEVVPIKSILSVKEISYKDEDGNVAVTDDFDTELETIDIVINTAEKEMVESGDVNQDDFVFPLSEGEQYIDKQEYFDEEDDPEVAMENWLEEVYACHNMSMYEHVYVVEVETEN